jgi:hypothetical protein
MSRECTPFHFQYAAGGVGMTSILGDRNYVAPLELIGSGLPTDGPWAEGGPLVWKPAGASHRLVGWMRGVHSREIARAGAWEAWGILVPEKIDINHWPWYWNRLKSGPTGIHELVRDFDQRKMDTGGHPRMTEQVTAVLTGLYLTDSESPSATYSVPIPSPEDTGLLAWVWLLGPLNPSVATVGPPRNAEAAVAPPLTYWGEIERDAPQAGSKVVRGLIVKFRKEGYAAVRDELNALRRDRPNRRKRLHMQGGEMQSADETSVSDDSAESVEESTVWRIKIPRLRREDVWGSLISFLLLLVLLGLAADRKRDIGILQAIHASNSRLRALAAYRAAPPQSAPLRNSPLANLPPPTAASRTAVVNWSREHISNERGKLSYTPELVNLAKRPNPKSATDSDRLYIAALQIFFTQRGWYTSSINGQLGQTLPQAARASAGSVDFDRAIFDDRYLLAQLQAATR